MCLGFSIIWWIKPFLMFGHGVKLVQVWKPSVHLRVWLCLVMSREVTPQLRPTNQQHAKGVTQKYKQMFDNGNFLSGNARAQFANGGFKS
jgi:hypothetical protein